MQASLKSLVLAVFAVVPMSAQETPSVAVENIQLDKEKEIVVFDVRNLSTKPIRAWTAIITLMKRKPDVPGMRDLKTEINWRSDRCARVNAAQSAAKDALHCTVSAAFGDHASTVISTEPKVTAILFEDGTTEGDVQVLNQESASRHARLVTADYWLTSFRQIRSAGSPVVHLEMFGKLLATPDSATPPGLALRGDVYPVWESMKQTVADALRRVEKGSSAETEAAALEKRLEDQARGSKRASDVFPWRGDASTNAEPTTQMENRVSGLNILRTEEHGGRLVAYIRNDYLREIAGYAIGWHNGPRDLSTLSGGAAIAPGEAFQIDTLIAHSPEAPPPVPEILCVVFQDRTGDGDPERIQALNEHWAGRLFARAVFIADLHALAELPESEIPVAIEKLASELKDHPPAVPDGNHSAEFLEGARMEPDWVAGLLLADLRQLRTPPNGEARLKQAVISFVEKLDRL